MKAGVATFEPGASIPPHTHPCEEAIVVIEGEATVHAGGRKFRLCKYDSTIAPPYTPHCFSNDSQQPMTLVYFYPSAEVSRDPYEDKAGDE